MSSLVRKSTERDGAGKTCHERCGKGPLYCPVCKNDIKMSMRLFEILFRE
jgi:hypothetical protein